MGGKNPVNGVMPPWEIHATLPICTQNLTGFGKKDNLCRPQPDEIGQKAPKRPKTALLA